MEVLQVVFSIIRTLVEKSQGVKIHPIIMIPFNQSNYFGFSFNFPTTSTSLSSTVTHLSSQHYSICFRRASGYCAVCFWTAIAISTVPNPVSTQASKRVFSKLKICLQVKISFQSSFGLSVSNNAIANMGRTSVLEAGCKTGILKSELENCMYSTYVILAFQITW